MLPDFGRFIPERFANWHFGERTSPPEVMVSSEAAKTLRNLVYKELLTQGGPLFLGVGSARTITKIYTPTPDIMAAFGQAEADGQTANINLIGKIHPSGKIEEPGYRVEVFPKESVDVSDINLIKALTKNHPPLAASLRFIGIACNAKVESNRTNLRSPLLKIYDAKYLMGNRVRSPWKLHEIRYQTVALAFTPDA